MCAFNSGFSENVGALLEALQNHMSTSHTIRAHAQEVWNKSIKGDCQTESKVVTHDSNVDLPLKGLLTHT